MQGRHRVGLGSCIETGTKLVPPAQPVVRTESHVLDIACVLGAIALFVLCDLAVKGAKSLS
ncbi:MAG: hypothetical protein R5N68_02570 [Cutibacterium granulosum]|nr:hypothetical protein [Cutibacterium granulosum]